MDFILESGGGILCIEVKSGMTVRPELIRPLKNVIQLWDDQRVFGRVIYGGDKRISLKGCEIIPWSKIGELQI